jgi:hypothetical protein
MPQTIKPQAAAARVSVDEGLSAAPHAVEAEKQRLRQELLRRILKSEARRRVDSEGKA